MTGWLVGQASSKDVLPPWVVIADTAPRSLGTQPPLTTWAFNTEKQRESIIFNWWKRINFTNSSINPLKYVKFIDMKSTFDQYIMRWLNNYDLLVGNLVQTVNHCSFSMIKSVA